MGNISEYELKKLIENIEFEQRLDGNMRQVRLVMPIVPGLEAMHVTGVEAQKAQLRFILLTAAGICKEAGKLTTKTEIQKVLVLLLSQIEGSAKPKPKQKSPPKTEQH